MTDAPALELLGVSKRFGSVVALDNADLVVRGGTVHALLGENGAGKTTLMRVAYGILRPDTGTVRVHGRDVQFSHPGLAIAEGIGMVHQHPANVPAMTVAENIALGGHGPYRPREVRDAAIALGKRLGFEPDPRARVSDLSVAAQQRLEILKAVSRNARILILDEPTAVLAPAEARDLLGWLRRFAAEGGTAIIITHKLAEARTFSDELTVMREGRVVLSQRSADTSDDALATAMIGRVETSSPAASSRAPGARPVARAHDVKLLNDRGAQIISDATFDVHEGEIVGIAAVEGSGHHELLLALAGRHPIASGALALPERIGLVPEDRHRDAVVLDFSLTENVAINGAGGRRGPMNWDRIETRTSSLLTAFGVRSRGAGDRMATLSGGNQQKVVLAREVDANPQLLVVENPTRGLDIRATAFIRHRIRAARESGMAIVFYSSDLDEVLDMADRVLVVHAGQVRWVDHDRTRVGAAMLGAP